jgi:hypothetical protein
VTRVKAARENTLLRRRHPAGLEHATGGARLEAQEPGSLRALAEESVQLAALPRRRHPGTAVAQLAGWLLVSVS